jgi:hypothetical protein
LEEAGGIEVKVVVVSSIAVGLARLDFLADIAEQRGVFEDFEGAPICVECCIGACT